MDLAKSLDYFDPSKLYNKQIHIIGVGAGGSIIAENLARFGVQELNIYDFDKVESHNIANQLYTEKHIGQYKTDALKEILKDVNPALKVNDRGKWEPGKRLKGYVFVCVDTIATRKDIYNHNLTNSNIDLLIDCRMTLTEGQAFTIDWKNPKKVEAYYANLDFTQEEADANQEVSACGFTLSASHTIRVLAGYVVANVINKINEQPTKSLIVIDTLNIGLLAI